MSHREFTDASGRRWQVWDVYPVLAERRKRERRAIPRATPDRRKRNEKRAVVPPDLRDGWLCFETASERRRLAPVPPQWRSMTDAELERALDGARRIRSVLGAAADERR